MNKLISFLIFLSCLSTSISKAQTQLPEIQEREYAKTAPFSVARSPEKLAEYLTENDTTQAQKAFNIYTWITHNIAYDFKQLKKGKAKTYTVKQTLRRKKGICYQYAELFNVLCAHVGIHSKEVMGYSRGLGYREEDTFYEGDHSWNAVKLDTAWYLVDATWGAGQGIPKKQRLKVLCLKWFKKPYIRKGYRFVQSPDRSYFARLPEHMIQDHLPLNPVWQLLNYPVSVQTFEALSYKGYMHQQDHYAPQSIDPADLNIILEEYEQLSDHQYLYKTASRAHTFNPKNYKLLAIYAFNHAANQRSIPVSDKERIQYMEESIAYFKQASEYARNHIRSARAESAHTEKQVKLRIRLELENPLKGIVRPNEKRISRLNKRLTREESILKKEAQKQFRLRKEANTRLAEPIHKHQYKKTSEPLDSVAIEKNKQALQAIQQQIEEDNNHLNHGADHWLHLVKIKEQTSKESARLNLKVNALLEEQNSLLVENAALTLLSKSTDLILQNANKEDSVKNVVTEAYKKIEKEYYSRVKLLASEERNIAIYQRLVLKTCRMSRGQECYITDYRYYDGMSNILVQKKRDVHKAYFDALKQNFLSYKKEKNFLIRQNELLALSLKLISLYQAKRLAGIDSKRNKSERAMQRIVDESESAIWKINGDNRELKQDIREKEQAKRI